VAAVLALQGQRVGVIDADIVAPTLQWLFGVDDTTCNLNTYLRGECDILDTVSDVTPKLGGHVAGSVLFIPASNDAGEVARVARESYSLERLCQDADKLFARLHLDVLLLDAPAGLTEGSLFLFGLSDASAIVLRLDKQDYQGTSVLVDVARRLSIPRLMLVVNLTARAFDPAEVKSRIAKTYGAELVFVLPHSEEMLALSGAGIFAIKYPDHPLTSLFKQVATALTE
jgi:septum site-determining protein MinD